MHRKCPVLWLLSACSVQRHVLITQNGHHIFMGKEPALTTQSTHKKIEIDNNPQDEPSTVHGIK